jgi:polyisoprenoid-binding protein YceI
MNYGRINRNIFLVLFTLFSVFSLPFFEKALPVQANDSQPVLLPSEGRYKVNASQSKFNVKAFAGGLLSALAHDHLIAIRDFTGDVRFTYGTVEPASLELNIKAASLTLLDKVSDSDRQKIENTMRTEVLEVDKHPEIVFKSTNVAAQRIEEGKYQTKIAGELTLHGVTHPVTINGTVGFSQNSLQAEGQFTLRQTDYGIKPVSIAGGTIKVKNELKFTFDIFAGR